MFTFFAELFAFGGLAFWLLAIVVFGVITALVENEKGFWATVAFLGSLAGLNFLYKLPILDTIKIHPLYTASLVAAYFAIGIGWSFFKWTLFLRKGVIKYNLFKAKFLADNKSETLTPELAAKLADKIDGDSYEARLAGVSTKTPQFGDHAGTLTRWATYWPFSMVGFCLNDIVRKAWYHIINGLQDAYQAVAKSMFKSVTADMDLAKEFKAKKAAAGAESGGGSDAPRSGIRNRL
jgi:hypothetical protein